MSWELNDVDERHLKAAKAQVMPLFSGITALSFHSWGRLTDLTKNAYLLGWEDDVENYHLRYYFDPSDVGIVKSPVWAVESNGTVIKINGGADDLWPANVWKAGGGDWDSSRNPAARLRFDGVWRNSGHHGGHEGDTLQAPDEDLLIGERKPGSGAMWTGQIGRWGLWNGVLSDAEWALLDEGWPPWLVATDRLILYSAMTSTSAPESWHDEAGDTDHDFTHVNSPVYSSLEPPLVVPAPMAPPGLRLGNIPSASAPLQYGPWVDVACVPHPQAIYSDRDVEGGKTYQYEIRAKDFAGNASSAATDEATPLDGIPGPRPLKANIGVATKRSRLLARRSAGHYFPSD